MAEKEMRLKLRELRELKRMQDELSAEITALEDELKAAMGDREVAIVGEYKVFYKNVVSERVDTAAFKREMPGLAEQYTKKSVYRRFSVK